MTHPALHPDECSEPEWLGSKLHDQIHVTVSSDDIESFETDTVLVTIRARIPKAQVPHGMDEALRDIGQRITACSEASV